MLACSDWSSLATLHKVIKIPAKTIINCILLLLRPSPKCAAEALLNDKNLVTPALKVVILTTMTGLLVLYLLLTVICSRRDCFLIILTSNTFANNCCIHSSIWDSITEVVELSHWNRFCLVTAVFYHQMLLFFLCICFCCFCHSSLITLMTTVHFKCMHRRRDLSKWQQGA